MSGGTEDTCTRAAATLRRLSAEIGTFRRPDVQAALRSPGDRGSGAETEAALIAARTELSNMRKSLTEARAQALEARKRAARAEGQVEDLHVQIGLVEAQQRSAVESASVRIAALEVEHLNASKAAAESSILLRDAIERHRGGREALLAERDAAVREARESRVLASRYQNQLTAMKEEARIDGQGFAISRDSAVDRIESLEGELVKERAARKAAEGSASDDLANSAALTSTLQAESVRVKTELAGRHEEISRLRSSLSVSEQQLFDLQSKHRQTLANVEELPVLRTKLARMEDISRRAESSLHLLAGLSKEKDELSRLICALSPTGDAQEGLKILRDSAHVEGVDETGTGGSSIVTARTQLQTHQRQVSALNQVNRVELTRLNARVRELSKKLSEAEQEAAKASAERDEAQCKYQRNERLRRMLERERTHLKSALAEIENDYENDLGTGNSEKRTRERWVNAEAAVAEYKSAAADFEKLLRKSEEKVSQLSLQIAAAKAADTAAVNDDGITTGLRVQLLDAISQAAKADQEKAAAQAAADLAQAELATLQKVLSDMKLQAAISSEPLDYDPKTTKVLRVADGPLQSAMAAAAATARQAESGFGKKRMRLDVAGLEHVDSSGEGNGNEMITVVALKKELLELEKRNGELEGLSKVGQRTGEIAKRKIEEVRAAVYNLFGWSMKVTGAKYSISSIYADRPDDVLEFGVNAQGTMSLLESEYTQRLADEIEQYVHKMHSIPALLASITTDNFDKTTAFTM